MKPHIYLLDGAWVCLRERFWPYESGGRGATPELAYMAWWNEVNL